MPRFFVDSLDGDSVTIEGQDARHIALSLRMAKGEEVTVSDGRGLDATCILRDISPDGVTAEITERHASKSEPKVKVTLYQALPKSDKMELIIQKAVEMGVTRIVPVMASRCISRPDEKQMKKKIERWSKISQEAAMQSGRGLIPEIGETIGFEAALKEMSTYDLGIFFYEHAKESMNSVMEGFSGNTIAFMVGAEGGFSENETEKALGAGLCVASLGPRILRCETAPLAVMAAIMYDRKEMEP